MDQYSWINIAGAMKMVHVNDVSLRELKQARNTHRYNILYTFNAPIHLPQLC